MRLQLFRLSLWLLSLLPLRANHALGAMIGWLMWVLPSASRRITLHNLKLCYPDRDAAFIEQLARRSLMETGKSVTELGHAWIKPRKTLDALVRNVYGLEHLNAAKKQHKGILLISPHLGAWEFCMLPLAREQDSVVLYRPPRQPSLEPVLIAGRARHGTELAPLNPTGIKTVLKGLKQGRAVGILPDQEPDLNSGVFASFFNVPANTMTLLARLASKGDAGLVFIIMERLHYGRGYNLHYMPADEAIRSNDKQVAARTLNRGVEECISLFPHQYVWSYKRFRLREDGSRRNYN